MKEERLFCSRCGWTSTDDGSTWRCGACHGPLEWEGPRTFSRREVVESIPSLWRYEAVLPVAHREAERLGEQITPMIEGEIDGVSINWKLDYLLPSGSFKDRGSAVLISHLKKSGVQRAIEDSSGNAAASIAAYSARAGIDCAIFAPASTSRGKLVQTAAYGAQVTWVEGNRDDVAHATIDAAARDPSAAYASHNWHPFFIEGVKTWALEVWEQLGYRAPNHVVVTVGSGSMLLGAWRAFSLLKESGEISGIPRLFAAQPAACAPVHAAFMTGREDVEQFDRKPTIAEGASIAKPVRGRELLKAIRSSHGGTIAVSEDEIASAQQDLARQGMYIEPTSAVAAAGLRQFIRNGEIDRAGTTVVLLSGSGLKATETIQRLMKARSRG
jgi:threonine synthase